MAVARRYGDGCATAHAAELIGERWALLIVRELLLGPKRFADLQRGLPRVSPTVLSQRLRELEESDVLRRQRLGPPVSVSVYKLTEWGRELEPIVLGLARWAGRSASLDREAELGSDSLILHMRARYRGGAARRGEYEIAFGDDRFTIEPDGDELTARRGAANDPIAVVETTTATLTAVLRARLSLDHAAARGLVRHSGDEDAITRLLEACGFADAASGRGPAGR